MAGEWDVVDETPVRRKAAQAANEWDVVAEAPVAGLPPLGEPDLATRNARFNEGTTFLERLANNAERGWLGLRSSLAAGLNLPAIERGAQARETGLAVVGTDPLGLPIYADRPDDVIAVGDTAAGNLARAVAPLQAQQAAIPMRPATQAMMEADGFGEAASALFTDPLGVIGDIGVSSGVQTLPAVVATVVSRNPYVAAAAAGSTSAMNEYGAGVIDYLGKQGVDVADAAAVESALADPEVTRQAIQFARSRAGIIGAVDAASGGLASKAVIPASVVNGQLAREGANALVAQPLVQAALGAGGEAAAQLGTTGRISAGDVLAEAVGETFTAPVEAGAFAVERARNRGATAPAAPRADTPPSTAINPAPALGDDAELDALLLRNLPPEVVEGVLGDPNPAPAAPTPTPAGEVPERASLPAQDLVAEIAARMRQSAQERAAQSADVPRARTVPPSSQDTAAPAAPTTPAAEDVQASAAERLPAVDADLAQPIESRPVEDRPRKAPSREELAARDAAPPVEAAPVEEAPIADDGVPAREGERIGLPDGFTPDANGLIAVPTVYGDTVRVRAADYEGGRERLRTYQRDGQRARGDAVIHRENLDPDGSQRRSQPGLPYYAARARNAEKPFATAATAERAVTKAGQSLDDYEIRPVDGGFVAVRRGKAEALESTESVTDTPAFRTWFGASKVVDADGKPLVVYHGTTAPGGFDRFGYDNSVELAKKLGLRSDGDFFFTSNPYVASTYANEDGGSVLPVFLRMQNPHEFDAEGRRFNAKSDEDATYTGRKKTIVRAAIDAAYENGNDGVIIRNLVDEVDSDATGGGATPADVYIAFNREQIKSATGNRGTFDPDNPSILESQDTTEAVEVSDEELTEDERRVFRRSSPEERSALATLRAKSARERGESDASLLRDAVRKAVGDSPVRVAYTRGMAGLKGLVKDGYIQQLEDRQRLRGTKMRTSGLYITADQTIDGDPLVVLFTDVVNTPGLAAFTAAHEIAGHHGLRALLGADLDKALSIAEQNSTVKAVADSMMRRRKMAPAKRLRAIEEALADLAAASRTGNYDTIAERHGVEVPTAQRKTLAGAIARFVERVKALFSRRGVPFTDAQVHDLLVDAWRAGQSMDSVRSPEPLESTTDNPSILESVDYTPEQSAALAKAGLPVDRRTTLQKVRDGLREEWHKVRDAARDSDALKQATFDKFHGLRMAEARVGLTDPAVSPYIAARMSAGLGSAMESLLLYGAPKWQDGVLAIDENTVGLLDALKPVEGSVDEFLGWMVGRRAKLLKAQGREHNLSDGDIDALLSLASGREQAFQRAAKEYLKVKTAVLDVAEEAGLIDPEARAAWDHAEYIPFYRAENESVIGPGTRKGLAGQSSGIRTLKGSEQALADPLANIVRNFTRLLDSAGKNRATLLAVDQLGEAFFTKAQREFQPATIPLDQVKRHLAEQGVSEQAIAGMPPAALKGVARMLSIVPPTGEDVVRVMRAGKPEYYTVLDPLVLRALTAFKQANKNLAIKPFIFFKRLLTTGVTTTAEFVGANFLRDSGSAWVISDDRFIPGWDSVRGVVETLRNDKTNREMMMAGGTFLGGQFYGGDPDSAAAALRRALRQKGLTSRQIEGFVGTVARTPLHLWDGWLKLSGGVENANRRAVYDAAIRAGRSKLEAAYAARDLMDFSMQGDAAWVQFFADVLPFFNARLQGLYKLGRRAGTPEGKRAIALRGGVIALASVGLMAWNLVMHGDAYDELEEWDKDAYWHIAPGTEYHIRIPKPFEIGIAFATIPERIMAAIQHARTDGESGDRPAATFDSALRAITGTLAMNPIPQGALPIVEQWANKRFFSGRPIENMGDDKLLPEAREEWFTSDTAKLIADVAGNKTGLSAKRIEHLWNGYTGGLGAYLLDSFDWVVRQVKDAPERPEMALRDFPLVGRFARGANPPPNPKSVGEFYDLLARAEEIEGTIKEYYARSGNPDMQGEDIGERAFELMEEHRWLLGETYNSKRLKAGIGFENVRDMRKVRSKLSDLRQEADDVAMSKSLSAHDKRVQLDEIAAKRAKLARDMVRKLRAAERPD